MTSCGPAATSSPWMPPDSSVSGWSPEMGLALAPSVHGPHPIHSVNGWMVAAGLGGVWRTRYEAARESAAWDQIMKLRVGWITKRRILRRVGAGTARRSLCACLKEAPLEWRPGMGGSAWAGRSGIWKHFGANKQQYLPTHAPPQHFHNGDNLGHPHLHNIPSGTRD